MKEIHAFAKQWLDRLGNKIFDTKGNQILAYEGNPKYQILPLRTHLKLVNPVDEPILSEEEAALNYKYIPYSELQELGFVVIGVEVEDPNKLYAKFKQHKWYKLAIKKTSVPGVSADMVAKAVWIQHDPIGKRVRLLNKNSKVLGVGRIDSGVTEWMEYGKSFGYAKSNAMAQSMSIDEMRNIGNIGYSGDIKYDAETKIPELVVLLSDDGYYVCIPRESIDATSPVPRILIVGESGLGKTTATLSISSRLIYKFQDRVIFLIDGTDQLTHIMLPQDNENFIKKLELIGEEPRPLPIVIFYLASNEVNEKTMVHIDEGISFKVPIDFETFLNKYTYYTESMDCEVNTKYLDDYKKDFLTVTSKEEVVDVIRTKQIEEGVDPDKQGARLLQNKYRNSFGTIFSYKFTSNMYQNDPYAHIKWKVYYKDGTNITTNPIIAAYEAGLMPVINIAHCWQEPWFRNALAGIEQEMINYQVRKGKDNQKRIWIIEDEMDMIYEEGKKKDRLKDVDEFAFRKGRVNKLGRIGNTQSYAKLSEEQRKNATHLFCYRIEDSKERNAIRANFNLDKQTVDQMEVLKKFEVIVISKEPWVIYDRFGRKVTDERVTKKKCWKGTVLPPICYNYSPLKIQRKKDDEKQQMQEVEQDV